MISCKNVNSFLVLCNGNKGNIIIEVDGGSSLQFSESCLHISSIQWALPLRVFAHPPPISTTARLLTVQNTQRSIEDRIERMLEEERLALEY